MQSDRKDIFLVSHYTISLSERFLEMTAESLGDVFDADEDIVEVLRLQS